MSKKSNLASHVQSGDLEHIGSQASLALSRREQILTPLEPHEYKDLTYYQLKHKEKD